MKSQSIWNVSFVAGNPDIFTKVIVDSDNPMRRGAALEAAKKIADKGWRVWVDNAAGKRIFESQPEVDYKTKKHSEKLEAFNPTDQIKESKLSLVEFDGVAQEVEINEQKMIAVWTDGVMLSSDNGKSPFLPGIAPCVAELKKGKRYRITIEEIED